MALSTYDEIKTAITQWAERSDISSDLVDQFIYMTEADAYQQLRVPAMEHQALLTVDQGRVVIPFDYLELRRLTWEGTNETVLEYLPWDQFVTINADPPSTPMYFSRQGANWFISGNPGDDQVILCHYYRYFDPLTADNTSTWLLALSPQTYLFGGLKYLYEYVMDQDRAAYWAAKFDKELNKLQAIADLSEHRGTTLSVKSI